MFATFWENGIVTIQGIYWSWKMTQFFVCNNCNMSIFIQYYNVEERVFCILHMLRIHTGLRKWNKKDRFIFFFVTRIHRESNNHSILLKKMKCCLSNIEFLLSGTNMQLILKGGVNSSVTNYFWFCANNVWSYKSIIWEGKKSSYRYNIKISFKESKC